MRAEAPMKKISTGIQRKDGISALIEDSHIYPEEPTRKDMVNHLLNNLNGAREHYEKEFLAFDKKSIPRDFLHIFWGLRNEVCYFLEYFEQVEKSTKSGKSIGRNKSIDTMKIAIDVVNEYRFTNNIKNGLPTGQYLYEKVNAKINAMALRGEPCPMDISLRACQDWIKKMREGRFP